MRLWITTCMDTFRKTDSSREAIATQVAALQKIGIEGRAAMVFELSDNLRELVEAGIRRRHPDYTSRQVVQGVLRLILNKDMFERIFPGCEVEP